jgi:FlaG/FlaF family flagellin (archaellin)
VVLKMIVAKKRKAISTFIATLLLMVLAVAAGVVIYAYTMGYLGGFTTPQTMGALSLDSAVLSSTGGLTAYIRNIGHSPFTYDTAYITFGTTTVKSPGGGLAPNTLAEGAVGLFTIPIGEFTGGTLTYSIKLIGKDNTQITFNVK